jgi:hypothetical protein
MKISKEKDLSEKGHDPSAYVIGKLKNLVEGGSPAHIDVGNQASIPCLIQAH